MAVLTRWIVADNWLGRRSLLLHERGSEIPSLATYPLHHINQLVVPVLVKPNVGVDLHEVRLTAPQLGREVARHRGAKGLSLSHLGIQITKHRQKIMRTISAPLGGGCSHCHSTFYTPALRRNLEPHVYPAGRHGSQSWQALHQEETPPGRL